MPRFLAKESAAAAYAAYAYLSGLFTLLITRVNLSLAKYSISNAAALYYINTSLTKKYIYLLKARKSLPFNSKRGTLLALIRLEK
jgi:hypothetical protein